MSIPVLIGTMSSCRLLSSVSQSHCTISVSSSQRFRGGLLHRVLDSILLDIFLPVLGTVDTRKSWHSQVCPRAIGGITTCHKMRHSLSLPTSKYICMGELPHFHHGPTTSFLHSQPIQTPPSGPGLICAAGQVFIWDDPSSCHATQLIVHQGRSLLYPQCGTNILF